LFDVNGISLEGRGKGRTKGKEGEERKKGEGT
jgi:hypothetical protein